MLNNRLIILQCKISRWYKIIPTLNIKYLFCIVHDNVCMTGTSCNFLSLESFRISAFRDCSGVCVRYGDISPILLACTIERKRVDLYRLPHPLLLVWLLKMGGSWWEYEYDKLIMFCFQRIEFLRIINYLIKKKKKKPRERRCENLY